MILDGAEHPGRRRDARRAQHRQQVVRREATNPMLVQDARDGRPGQVRRAGGRRRPCEQRPEPRLVGARAERQEPGRDAIELLAEAIAQAPSLRVEIFFEPGELTKLDQASVLRIEPPKGADVGDEGAGQHAGVAAIIFRPGDGVEIPKAIELFGIEGVDVEAALETRLNQRSSSRRAPSQVLFARGQHGALDEVPYYDDSLPMYRVRTRVDDKRRRSRLLVRVRADDPSPPLRARAPRASRIYWARVVASSHQ